MAKVAFLFAGQGAQRPGMGKSVYEASPAARAAYDIAERIRPGVIAQCFDSDAYTLQSTEIAQPCLCLTDYAIALALGERGIRAQGVAGFSLGELAAVAYAGVLPFDALFRLVCVRAEAMSASAKAHEGAMAAVLKLEAAEVEALCDTLGDVYPVNYNCPGQIVVSGTLGALTALEAGVKAAGGRFLRLNVGGCFHTPFMREAAKTLVAYMDGLPFMAPNIPLYANSTAAPYAHDAAALLGAQVESPVLWERSIRRMLADGFDTFIEVGPGVTLTGFMKKIGGYAQAFNVEDAQGLETAVAALGGCGA